GRLLWGSISLSFFFLDRCSELWGPVTVDISTGKDRAHCVNVIVGDKQGKQVGSEAANAHSVEILFESHKGDRNAQGVTIQHYRSDDPLLCLVLAAQTCLRVRTNWRTENVTLGPYLKSISQRDTIKKAQVTSLIKNAVKNMGLSQNDYFCHSLRIGGACTLLAAGKSGLVIWLIRRRSIWCFSVYTRLRPGMIRDTPSSMIKVSAREHHKPHLISLEGEGQ
ncbi:hypothetical protein JG687_00016065, partial [Phytophthora cactorum]